MPRPLPVTGHFGDGGDYKEDHEKHFGFAIQDALNRWAASSDADQDESLQTLDVRVVLEATITPNPGGVSQYRATITPPH
jgi:hypothetical protein